MPQIEREDIQIISRHSNWSEKGIDKVLKEDIYNDKEAWQKFLSLFFISLGIGFTTAGIIFFFAYNWADLNKFFKIGLIEALIVTTTLIVLFSKLDLTIKKILLTGSSLLIGVLFAVFGQIYQTGANAYDFFLGWTLFITLWVIISNFAPLWLIFVLLVNTTVILYSQQVAQEWSEIFNYTLLFVINSVFLISALLIKHFIEGDHPPAWFSNSVAITAVFFSTVGIYYGIFEEKEFTFYVLFLLTSLLYGLGIYYGLKVKSGFYISIILLSSIIVITAFLLEKTLDAGMLLFISLFIIISVTFAIKLLINLQKKWTN